MHTWTHKYYHIHTCPLTRSGMHSYIQAHTCISRHITLSITIMSSHELHESSSHSSTTHFSMSAHSRMQTTQMQTPTCHMLGLITHPPSLSEDVGRERRKGGSSFSSPREEGNCRPACTWTRNRLSSPVCRAQSKPEKERGLGGQVGVVGIRRHAAVKLQRLALGKELPPCLVTAGPT